MLEMILIWVVLVFLAIVSVIDWKFHAVPSVFLTGMLFVVLALNPANLFYGILAGVLALFLYDADFIGGVADIKATIIIGLMIASLQSFFVFTILMMLYGVIYKVIIKKALARRKKKPKQFAFLPVYFFVYVAMVLAGLI